jgi:hypothetical protein
MSATPTDARRDEMIAVLDRAARPKAALEFPFLPMLRELVFATTLQADLKSSSSAEWRAKVRAAANPPRRGRGGAQ